MDDTRRLSDETIQLQRGIEKLNAGDPAVRGELLNIACGQLMRLTSQLREEFSRSGHGELPQMSLEDLFAGVSTRLYESLVRVPIKDTRHFYQIASIEIRRELIGTSVEVGEVMAATQIGDSHTWIADLRQDVVDGRPKRGLLLHYPGSATRSEPITTERLSSDLVEELRDTDFAYDKALTEEWLTGDSDHNSIHPVVINGRSPQPFNLGWVVITAEAEP